MLPLWPSQYKNWNIFILHSKRMHSPSFYKLLWSFPCRNKHLRTNPSFRNEVIWKSRVIIFLCTTISLIPANLFVKVEKKIWREIFIVNTWFKLFWKLKYNYKVNSFRKFNFWSFLINFSLGNCTMNGSRFAQSSYYLFDLKHKITRK